MGSAQAQRRHDCAGRTVVGITSKKVNWILDADIRSFSIRLASMLIRFVEHRMAIGASSA